MISGLRNSPVIKIRWGCRFCSSFYSVILGAFKKVNYLCFMAERYKVNLKEKRVLADRTMSFHFDKPEGFEYKAGQTVDLTIPFLEENNTRTFSLITEPKESRLAVATRITDSEFKQTLSGADIGADLEIEGPYGEFRLHEDTNKMAVFLVGGIGVTPFMSMIKDVMVGGKEHDIYMLYSNRRPEDVAFREELQAYSESNDINLDLVFTMTNAEDSSEEWSGERGYINWEMIRKYVPEDRQAVYYTSGAPAMVEAMRTMLKENNVSDDDLRFDTFSGY